MNSIKMEIKEEIDVKEEPILVTMETLKGIETIYIKQEVEFKDGLFDVEVSEELSLEVDGLSQSDKYTTSKGVDYNEVVADQKCKPQNSDKCEPQENNHTNPINENLVEVKLEACEEEGSNILPKNVSNDKILPISPFKMAICETTPVYNCNNSFPSTFDTNSKLFSCEICGKPFRKKGYLKEHMISHSNEKPFSCKICDKTFKKNSNLTGHMKSHSDERPHECDICDKRYRRKSDLRRHVLSHSSKKLHLCEICHRSFKRKPHLKDHIISHSGIKPFVCKICGKSYKQKRSLKSHMLNHANGII